MRNRKPRNLSDTMFRTLIPPILLMLMAMAGLILYGLRAELAREEQEARAALERLLDRMEAAERLARGVALEASLQSSIIHLMNGNGRASIATLQSASAYINGILTVHPVIRSISVCSRTELVMSIPEPLWRDADADIFRRAGESTSMRASAYTVDETLTGRTRGVLGVVYRYEGEESPMSVLVEIDADELIRAFREEYPGPEEYLLADARGDVVFSTKATDFGQPFEGVAARIEHNAGRVASMRFELPGGLVGVRFAGSIGAWSAAWMIAALLTLLCGCALLAGRFCRAALRLVGGVSRVCGEARVGGDARVYDDATISGEAWKYGAEAARPAVLRLEPRVDSAVAALEDIKARGDEGERLAIDSLFTRLFAACAMADEGYLLREILRHGLVERADEKYCVAVMRADGVEAYRRNHTMDIIAYQMDRAAQKFAEHMADCRCIPVRMGAEETAFFIVLGRASNPTTVEAMVELALADAMEQAGLSFTVGLSDIRCDLNGLRGAYRLARENARARLTLGPGRVCTPENVCPRTPANAADVQARIERLEAAWTVRDATVFARELDDLLDVLWESGHAALLGAIHVILLRMEAAARKMRIASEDDEVVAARVENFETRAQVRERLVVRMGEIASALALIERSCAGSCIPRAVQYIDEHFADASMSVQRVAEVFHISPQYFSKLFNQEVGCSFPQYLADKRLMRAHELLDCEQTLTIHEVCTDCGYVSRTHFTASFKKKFGVSPSKVRYSAKMKQAGIGAEEVGTEE